MSNDERTVPLLGGSEMESYSTGDPDADAVLGLTASSASASVPAVTGDPGASVPNADHATSDEDLAALGPELYAMFTNATPEQMEKQLDRCLRDDVPGWRQFAARKEREIKLLTEFTPDTLPN